MLKETTLEEIKRYPHCSRISKNKDNLKIFEGKCTSFIKKKKEKKCKLEIILQNITDGEAGVVALLSAVSPYLSCVSQLQSVNILHWTNIK